MGDRTHAASRRVRRSTAPPLRRLIEFKVPGDPKQGASTASMSCTERLRHWFLEYCGPCNSCLAYLVDFIVKCAFTYPFHFCCKGAGRSGATRRKIAFALWVFVVLFVAYGATQMAKCVA
jgi:hypothetical protein